MQPPPTTMADAMRALFVAHTGMSEPLRRSQVLPYLRGLARLGWRIDIVCFEPATAEPAELRQLGDELAADGLGYSWARRSPSHTLATKLLESADALRRLLLGALRHRPRIVHARSHLPAAVAHAVAALSPGARFLFDCRGCGIGSWGASV
jgi:hypothetical protein